MAGMGIEDFCTPIKHQYQFLPFKKYKENKNNISALWQSNSNSITILKFSIKMQPILKDYFYCYWHIMVICPFFYGLYSFMSILSNKI
jgi:hypothetical protein